MDPQDCKDKVRFSISDSTGVLRLESFELVDMPMCQETAELIRTLILNKPLSEVDIDRLREIPCAHNRECVQVIAALLNEYKTAFAHE